MGTEINPSRWRPPLAVIAVVAFFVLTSALEPKAPLATAQNLIINPSNHYCSQVSAVACKTIIADNLNPNRLGYLRGESIIAYVRFKYSNSTYYENGTVSDTEWITETAQFYPYVDQYTALVVPSTAIRLITYASVTVTVDFVFAGSLYQALPERKWARNQKVVPFRTAILTMNGGFPTAVNWESTKCYFSDCDCVDDMCPQACTDLSKCDLRIYIGWAGSDREGNILNSASLSIYRFQNVV